VKLATAVEEVRAWRTLVSGAVGLVPTMGALHDGHLSLIKAARRRDTYVVVTVFVNPTQFGPKEDLSRYPRDLDRDRDLLAAAGVDLLFAPGPAEVYPPGFDTWVEVAGPSRALEGERRPGHFRGVATVVAKLFGIVQPHHAYFGRKDAQQLAVLTKMARDLNLPVEIVPCPIHREPDGLAMSSRNVYLSPAERDAGPVLRRALAEATRLWKGGERDADRLRDAMTDVLAREPLARIDYVSVADPDSFEERKGPCETALCLLAVFFGATRLIDNQPLPEPPGG
jgi:pantoate--beta-alanine ligase